MHFKFKGWRMLRLHDHLSLDSVPELQEKPRIQNGLRAAVTLGNLLRAVREGVDVGEYGLGDKVKEDAGT
eukprot:11185141-Lingulodinium_polyedra.AAC.1